MELARLWMFHNIIVPPFASDDKLTSDVNVLERIEA